MQEDGKKLIRKLSYRKQIHWVSSLTKYALISMSIALILSFGLYTLTEVFSELIHVNMEFILISWGLFFIFIFIEYFAILRPLKNKCIDLFDDKLVIKIKGNEKHLYFNKIKSIQCKHGYFVLKFNNNTNHSFSFAIERCDYILEQLNKQRPDLFDKKSFMNLRKSIVLSDHSVARFYDLFHGTYKLFTLLFIIGVPSLLSLLIILKQYYTKEIIITPGYVLDLIATNYLVFIIIGLTFPMITNFIFNKIKSKELIMDYKNKYRNLKFELKIYKLIAPVYILLVLLISFSTIKYDLNLLGLMSIDNDQKVLVKNKYINKRLFPFSPDKTIVFYDLETKKYLQANIIQNNGRKIASDLIKVKLSNGNILEIKFDQIKGEVF